MRRWAFLCLLPAFGLVFPCLGEDQQPAQITALENAIQRTVAATEPAIACILVSRSEAYGRLPGRQPAPETTGKLGDFDPAELRFLGKNKFKQELRRLDLADPDYVPEAFGSGVVIDAAGLVLTNYHVIRDATKVFVRLPGGKGSYADIQAADPRSDLAVLRLRDTRLGPLRAIPLGDAAKIKRGQFVITLANPYAAGFRDGQPSASWGIVSNLRRRVPGERHEKAHLRPLHYYGTLLQTDTRVSLGCSGGAVLNLAGELIGLTTSLAAIHGGETPGGYAFPLDSGMRRILEVLKRGEEVEYGFLGVNFDEERPELGTGVKIHYVVPGSPAKLDARLNQQDVILAVNDTPVQDSDDLFLQLGTQFAGTKVALRVLRAGRRQAETVHVALGKFYVPGKKIASSLGQRPFFRGVRVDYTTLLVQPPETLPFVPAGVLVSDVQPGSRAAQAQLKPGEVITRVNNRPVASPAAFYQAVLGQSGPVELQLHSLASHEPPPRVLLK